MDGVYKHATTEAASSAPEAGGTYFSGHGAYRWFFESKGRERYFKFSEPDASIRIIASFELWFFS